MSTTWTPRPPSPDEPACWSWPFPPVLTDEERRARHAAEQEHVHPDERLTWSAMELVLKGSGDIRMLEFHADRCAACGRSGKHLVDDHDHFTGRVRGFLCRSCNTLEGVCRPGVLDLYRETHPAKILGIERYYTGRGWPLGWWWNWRTAWRLTGNEAWLPPGELEKWRNRPDVTAGGMLGMTTPTPNHHR